MRVSWLQAMPRAQVCGLSIRTPLCAVPGSTGHLAFCVYLGPPNRRMVGEGP